MGKTKIKINVHLNLHGTVSIASASVSMDLYVVLFVYHIRSFDSVIQNFIGNIELSLCSW